MPGTGRSTESGTAKESRFVLRYQTDTGVDGPALSENTFSVCSLWLGTATCVLRTHARSRRPGRGQSKTVRCRPLEQAVGQLRLDGSGQVTFEG